MNHSSLLRNLLGIVFLLASFDKLQHPEAFAQIISNYKILPELFVNPAALLLPWLEFICGIALILNLCARGAALLTTVLMAVFLVALGFNYMRGLDVACGCFSTDPTAEPEMLWSLIRDGIISTLSLTVLVMLSLEHRKSH
ncbi:MAG: MauE/DoxX family redox-associated membrane protein [Desulfovibrionaceae bacterium]